jgi:pullulanase
MKYFLLLLMPLISFSQTTQVNFTQLSFDEYPVYKGNDLGIHFNNKETIFKVWAPVATEVVLRLYESSEGGEAISTHQLSKLNDGVWQINITKNIKDKYYTFQVLNEGKWSLETPDIYVKAVGVNGKRGMIVDLQETNPINWENDKRPILNRFTDIIIYESHVRDISISDNSGIKHKGKFLGFTEKGTNSKEGISTGLDHMKELGITHIHLLPSFDFNSIDESKLELNNYNWGYDPVHYNVPEGSFSTDPYNGKVRIKEFKQMVQSLHENGIRVILDVVYNHTAHLNTSFNQFAPGYFYRHKADGSYSDASACGNETASERAMMRKFIIESVVYWAKEYHLDGFRFDLMGILDIETMNQVSEALHKVDPTIFIYGEGWTAGTSPLAENLRAVKKNTDKLKKIAAFSDDIRDGLRGPFNNTKQSGFVSAVKGTAESVKFGIVASTQHPQVDYSQVNHSKASWAAEPYQTINYVSCHDDPTLFDRLAESNLGSTEADLIKMDKLAQTVVLTSQGIVFLHSGAELLRTKNGVHNSYKSPDSINQIDWSRKTKYKEVFDYYKGLVSLRKTHPAFRMPSTKMIQEHLRFIDTADELFIAYKISGYANGDQWKEILVLLNGDTSPKQFTLTAGNWTLVADGKMINENGLKQVDAEIIVPATTGFILYKNH